MMYRIFVTESLRLAPQNRFINQSYYDIINKKIDNRSGDEIAMDVIERLGLKV